MNFKLLIAIREQGLRQRDFAKLIGEDETILSRVINGHWNPDELRKIKYAKALKMRVEDLFSETSPNC